MAKGVVKPAGQAAQPQKSPAPATDQAAKRKGESSIAKLGMKVIIG